MKDSIASKFAYAAAAFFFVGLIVSIGMRPPEGFEGVPPLSVVLTTVAFLIYHLAMLPVIAALPSPSWAKGSGFAWIVVDNMLNMLSFFGEGSEFVTPLRWGVHLATATWILGASWSQRGAFRWVGVLVTLALSGITLVGPFLNRESVPQSLGPAALLFIVWIVMAGRQLGRSEAITQ